MYYYIYLYVTKGLKESIDSFFVKLTTKHQTTRIRLNYMTFVIIGKRVSKFGYCKIGYYINVAHAVYITKTVKVLLMAGKSCVSRAR